MSEDKTTQITIKVDLLGHTVELCQAVSDHELEKGVAALLNSAIRLENNLDASE